MSTTAALPVVRETVDDLLREPGKAELIGGRIVRFMPTGNRPSYVAFRIARRLADHIDGIGRGIVHPDGVGYTVRELPSGRESFSPDVSYYTGQLPPNDNKFIEGPPDFAVEVRSDNDHGPAAERAMAAKRNDYFAAGTVVVWDVDPDAKTITAYRADSPDRPTTFGPGSTADAEPAVPGWRLPVDWLMARAAT